ncbi:hypothetical protein LGK97_00120 [Clostridium sp. CS001]|uniref:hypothetical protein n=1 Tax=Clostridium sp. CS001 TaxID=2880648 RepID=UPI001CF4F30A|nr:hypothetical protein [Clostridium sp. CS001]MCB2288167.1 hypothetical protein [Clostridium sp. CS001]
MAKIMSILEKYNLVEKGSKDKSEHIILNEDINNKVAENNDNELNEVNNIFEIKPSDYNEEIKISESVIKETYPLVASDIEYENIMPLNEIYSLYKLKDSNINTVFMLQNLINALPQDLPKDVIKQSVINIINTSNIDLNELISDGEERQAVLIKVIDGYNSKINKRINEYKEEIDKLSKLISNCQEEIKIKENMLEEQTHIIKYETQKIDGIIDFFRK